MVDRFPVVLRGYDKEKVDAAFDATQESMKRAQQTLASMREQIAADDDRILQLQAQLQEEKNKKPEGNSFASLGANAQQMLASAEQTSTELLERAKQDASSIRTTAQAQAETLINNAKLDAQHIVDDANAKAASILTNANNQAESVTTSPTRTPHNCAPKPPRPSPNSVRPSSLSSATRAKSTPRRWLPNAPLKSAKSPT